MTERERLIDLIKQKQDGGTKYGDHIMHETKCSNAELADYLLENGVLMFPVKVGDTVYILDKLVNVIEGEVVKIEYTCEAENYSKFIREKFLVSFTSSATQYDFYDIGKFVFLTKEDAENALAERGYK